MEFSDNILAILPDPSRAKLEKLLIEWQAARAAYIAAADAEMYARQELGRLEGMARAQLDMPAGVEIDVHPAAAVVEARRLLTKSGQAERDEREARILAPVEAARRRLQLALDARDRAAERQNAFAFLEGVSAWLNRAGAFGIGRLKHHAPAAPKTRDPVAEIQKRRAELAGLDEAWQAAEGAPAPVSELKARFLAELDQTVARGAPKVNHAARAGSPVNLSAALRMRQEPISLPGADTPHFALDGDAGAAFWTWLHRDLIAERVISLIDAAPAKGALTDEDRDAEFTRISTRRLEIERAEESLIVAAEKDGRTIQRRRDADPRALLEIVEA